MTGKDSVFWVVKFHYLVKLFWEKIGNTCLFIKNSKSISSMCPSQRRVHTFHLPIPLPSLYLYCIPANISVGANTSTRLLWKFFWKYKIPVLARCKRKRNLILGPYGICSKVDTSPKHVQICKPEIQWAFQETIEQIFPLCYLIKDSALTRAFHYVFPATTSQALTKQRTCVSNYESL